MVSQVEGGIILGFMSPNKAGFTQLLFIFFNGMLLTPGHSIKFAERYLTCRFLVCRKPTGHGNEN